VSTEPVKPEPEDEPEREVLPDEQRIWNSIL
jgi:hypothetical protein